MIDRDRLNSAPRGPVAKAMVNLFSTLQQLPKEIQLLALAAAFSLMIDVTKLPPQDAHTAVKNLMRDEANPTRMAPQFDAMRFHLETELEAQRQ